VPYEELTGPSCHVIKTLFPLVLDTPVSGTDCGLPATLSFIDSAAESDPTTFGLKVTVAVQFVLGASEVQVFVCENWLAFVPVIESPENVSVAVPVLVSVMFVLALP
jgi:hypothetical protein